MLNNILYSLTRALFHCIGGLSDPSRERLAVMIGSLAYKIDLRHRRVTRQNLQSAFGGKVTDKQIDSLARQVFINLGHIFLEIGWSTRLPQSLWPRYFQLSGLGNLKLAVSQGKGVLLLAAHFGNWELLPILAQMAGFKVHIVYRPLDSLFLDRLILENRSRFGAVMVPMRRAMQKVYPALRRGNMVALLMDQNVVWNEGVFTEFFGRPACTNTSMAKLALRTGAPVVPVFTIRQNGKFSFEVGPPIYPLRTGDATRDVEENTQAYTRVIENFVRRYPDQWFWVHQRWRTKNHQPWPDPVRRADWLLRRQRSTL